MRLRLFLVAGVAGAVLCALASAADAPVLSGWLSFGGGQDSSSFVVASLDASSLHAVASAQVSGYVSAEPLVVRGAAAGEATVYVATSHGTLYALDAGGVVLAQRQFGQIAPSCQYFKDSHLGITGTPVIDPTTSTLYLVDGTGLLYGLDPATLETKPGWPLRLVADPQREHVWGALTLAAGRLYVETGIVCAPANGRLLAVDPARQRVVARWQAIPTKVGPGGGVWGWGGATYDAPTRSILVLTGDAIPGGRNVGKRFDEAVAYAEHLVRLTPGLQVVAASTPLHRHSWRDGDLVGSPVVVRPTGCPALVAGEAKAGSFYVWRLDRIGRGPIWGKQLEAQLGSQPAWSPRTRSFYVAGYARIYRIAVTAACGLRVRWAKPLGPAELNGPPLVSGDLLWLSTFGDETLRALDAATGRVEWEGPLREGMLAQPVVLDGRVYAAGWGGLLTIFGAWPDRGYHRCRTSSLALMMAAGR